MSDIDHDEEQFDKAFEGFGDDVKPTTPPATEPPKQDDTTPPASGAPTEEPKKDEQPPAEPPKKEEGTPPAGDAPKTEEGTQPPKASETPPAPENTEEPARPLTKEDMASLINDVRTQERDSVKAVETATKDVLDAYYPDGLSNVLVDQRSGKELRTPADVVEATNGEMNTEQAAQWLLNEQFKLDKEVEQIKADATRIAETTLKFKQDSQYVLQRYDPLFKAFPQIQQKVWDRYHKQVKADQEKGVILSAPDMREYYDDFLEPYQQAFEYQKGQPATNPVPPTGQAPTPPAPKPSAEDRLDENGDGGVTAPNDPNDFAQQVTKELSKGA